MSRVKLGQSYVYRPTGYDLADPKTNLQPGARVTVVHPRGCPPPNTMGHCHVALEGKFQGLVLTASLQKE